MPFLHVIVPFVLALHGIETHNCDEVLVITGELGEVVRPNSTTTPNSGTNSCTITVTTEPGYQLKAVVEIVQGYASADPNAAGECMDNYVTVAANDIEQSGKICYQNQMILFDSPSDTLVITYKFINSVTGGDGTTWGFRATFTKIHPNIACGSFSSDLSGSINMYQFHAGGNSTKTPLTCKFTIKNEKAMKIRAVVQQLNLFKTDGCETDYLLLGSAYSLQRSDSIKVCSMEEQLLQYTTYDAYLVFELKVTNYTIGPSVIVTFEGQYW